MNDVSALMLHMVRSLIGLVLLGSGLALIWVMLGGRVGKTLVLEQLVGQGRRPQVRRKRFLTRVEQDTLAYLETAFPQFRVHCQVLMGALISPERFLGRNDALWTHRLYAQKIVDYVLQDRRSGDIVALVELDDFTHRHRRDHARDVLTHTRATAPSGCPRRSARRFNWCARRFWGLWRD